MRGHADELVRVVVQREEVVRIAEAEEDDAVSEEVPSQVGGGDGVVAVAEERAQDAAEDHLDQRHVLLGGRRRGGGRRGGLLVGDRAAAAAATAAAASAAATAARAAARSDPGAAEVGLVQHDLVDVESAGKADLVVLEDDVPEGVDGHQLLEPLLDAPDDLRADIDEPHPVGLPQHDGEVRHRFRHRKSGRHQLVLGLQVLHGEDAGDADRRGAVAPSWGKVGGGGGGAISAAA